MSLYQCYKCFYETNKKNNILFHFNRKNKCTRANNCTYSDNEIIIMNNKQLTFSLDDKIKENIPCKYCYKNFSCKFNMNKHIKKFHNNKLLSDMNVENINMCNITNNNNNNINITNIIVNIPKMIPFDKDWDLSHIDDREKCLLLFSNIMYTKLLEEILKNDINLNVIIDKDTKTGLVYSTDNLEEKYVNMDYEKIIKTSMEKLNKNLNDILDENKDKNLDYLNICEENINNKFNKCIDNNEIKKDVTNYISNIFETKKVDTLKIMKDVILNDPEIIGY